MDRKEQKSAAKLFWMLNAGWWALNLVQAYFMELANDEAYYWMFSRNMDWGYFDHPPMIAVFIFLGQFLKGELGVRFVSTLVQPVFLYLLWKIAVPSEAGRKSVWLFFATAFAMPILHVYGVVAVPDAPLMLFATLFVYAFLQYVRHDRWRDVLLMGLTIAAIGYSKYTGVLVVLFSVLAYPKILLRKGVYIAGVLAFVLLLPHLYWQYVHDWVSFRYHLIGRNVGFKWSFIWLYLLGFVGVFNPFLFPLFVLSGFSKSGKPIEMKILWRMAVFFFLFFLISCKKGNIQPQWFIAVVLSVVVLVWHFADSRAKVRKYVLCMGVVTAILMLFFRVELIFNHFHLKSEFSNNKTACRELAAEVGDKPVIFFGNYGLASKYNFYTGKEAVAYPNIYCRTHQYWLWTAEERWTGRAVAMEGYRKDESKTIQLSNGYEFNYVTDSCFLPTKRVEITSLDALPETICNGDSLHLRFLIKNPYPYAVKAHDIRFLMRMPWTSARSYILTPAPLTLEPASETEMQASVLVNDLDGFETPRAEAGFVLCCLPIPMWYNSKTKPVKTIIK